MILAHPTSYKAFIRLADTHRTDNPKLAALAYMQALAENTGLSDNIARRMRRLMTVVQWGPLVSTEELQSMPPKLDRLLLKPWPAETTGRLLPPSTVCEAPMDPRCRLLFLGHTSLPRFFSWIHPQQLAVSSTPRCEEDIDTFARMGITTVLTLTKEEPLDQRWFACRTSLVNVFLPISNGEAPSLAEMDVIWHRFHSDVDGCWLVHCGGGKGRAGVVTACLLAMNGTDLHEDTTTTPRMSKTEVITMLRTLRPGSIETVLQEKFIGEWISHRWRLASTNERVTEEPQFGSLRMEIDPGSSCLKAGQGLDNVDVVMLVGLPGSGKTWLATAIQKRRRTGKTVVLETDVDRTVETAADETVVNRHHDPNMLLILDGCHPDAADRRHSRSCRLLPSSFHRKPVVVVVHLNFSPELCLQRIRHRLGGRRPSTATGNTANHDTLHNDDEARVIQDMALRMQPPQLLEEELETGNTFTYSAILTVQSASAAWEAVLTLGGQGNEIIKFPRTPHLLDLGAVGSDDLVRAEVTLGDGAFIIEEKIDGANLGFSLSPVGYNPTSQQTCQQACQQVGMLPIIVQNRSHSLDLSSPGHIPAQFRGLPSWLRRHETSLRRILGRDDQFPDRYVLYGEWMAARHSIHYTHLPDFFLAFDLLDKVSGRFISRGLLTRLLEGSGIKQVPEMNYLSKPESGTESGMDATELTKPDLQRLVQSKSRFYDGPVEGIYVRWENADRIETVARGKVVRGDFLQGDKHWSKQRLVLNQVVHQEEKE